MILLETSGTLLESETFGSQLNIFQERRMLRQMKLLDTSGVQQNGVSLARSRRPSSVGGGVPEIDLFATSRNCVIDKFASWGPDPEASFIDSFQVDWGSFESVYIFPPIPLIPKIIQKIIMERARGILIVPKLGRTHRFGIDIC